MGLSSIGQLVISVPTTGSLITVTGMILPLNTWTHIVSTYSSTNGIRLYMNGIFVGSSNSSTHSASGILMTLTLGNALNGINCTTATVPTSYYGLIDEFRLYSRELTQENICALSNL